MTFEQRGSFFGIPTGRWKTIPTGPRTEEYPGIDQTIFYKRTEMPSVKITTNVSRDQSILMVKVGATTRVGLFDYRRTETSDVLVENSKRQIKVFAGAPGHRVIFRAGK